MRHNQKQKLTRLVKASDGMRAELDKASELLKSAENDEHREVAQKLVDETRAKLGEAEKEAADYKASLKPAGDAGNTGSGNDDKSAGETRPKGEFVTVTASADRRRAGLAFSRNQPVDIALDELTEEQLKFLDNDPVLVVGRN